MEKQGEGNRPPKLSEHDKNNLLSSSRGSPFSPFPYGSTLHRSSPSQPEGTPLQTSVPAPFQNPFTGSPGQKLLMNTNPRSRPASRTEMNGEPYTPRLKGQDLYGGPVMFGSSARRTRLMSSTPYSTGLSSRLREKNKSRLMGNSFGAQGNGFGPHTTMLGFQTTMLGSQTTVAGLNTSSQNNSTFNKSGGLEISEQPPVDAMSTTARLILDTLDKMSSPIQDAKRMPVPRAEKRKLVETELNCSLRSSPARRRPRLGAGPNGFTSNSLSGPPLRKNYSPLPAAMGRVKPPAPGAALDRDTSLLANPYIPSPPPSLPASPPPSKGTPFSSTPLPSTTDMRSMAEPSAAGGKMRAKVVEGREKKAELESPAVPAFLTNNIPILKVSGKLPDINFDLDKPASITPKESITSAEPVASKPSIPTFGLSKPFAPVSKSAQEPAKKVNNVVVSDTNSSITFAFNKPVRCTDEDTAAKTPSYTDTVTVLATAAPSYKFAGPEVVGQGSSTRTADVDYAFSPPKVVKKWVGQVETTTTTLLNFKGAAMPDVTHNFKNKGVDVIQGTEKGGLPDITASTVFGFGPASSLKMGGSVMDILGKKA